MLSFKKKLCDLQKVTKYDMTTKDTTSSQLMWHYKMKSEKKGSSLSGLTKMKFSDKKKLENFKNTIANEYRD